MKAPNQFRIRNGRLASDDSFGACGAFEVPFESNTLSVISTDGLGVYDQNGVQWEHVSVSLAKRCPNWREMC